jgi:hypothetical protein
MSNLSKNPKPHIEAKGIKNIPNISSSDRKRIIQEMKELINENNKIEAKYISSKNETVYE